MCSSGSEAGVSINCLCSIKALLVLWALFPHQHNLSYQEQSSKLMLTLFYRKVKHICEGKKKSKAFHLDTNI